MQVVHEDDIRDTSVPRPMLIAIAPSVHDQVKVTELVNGEAPLLLVSSADEAVEFLNTATVANGATVRATAPRSRHGPHQVGIVIDSDRRLASWESSSVGLSPLEHDVLRCLVDDVGHTWSFESLHAQVWGNSHLGGRADVQSVVKRLRRKLRQISSPLTIEAVRGVGLRLVHLGEPSRHDALHAPEGPAVGTTLTGVDYTRPRLPGELEIVRAPD
jgi:DNA-binding winged helix-turn-helix (wHTH) protein